MQLTVPGKPIKNFTFTATFKKMFEIFKNFLV